MSDRKKEHNARMLALYAQRRASWCPNHAKYAGMIALKNTTITMIAPSTYDGSVVHAMKSNKNADEARGVNAYKSVAKISPF